MALTFSARNLTSEQCRPNKTRMHAKKTLLKILLPHVWQALLILLASVCLAQQPLNPGSTARYYQMVQSAVSDTTIDLIAELQDHIKKNPHFKTAYLRLLEECNLAGKTQLADDFFTDRAAEKALMHHSNWMLAKIHQQNHQIDAANQAFQRALLTTTNPSSNMLIDYLMFENKYSKIIDEFFLDRLTFDLVTRARIVCLRAYARKQFETAATEFQKLPEAVRNASENIYAWGNCYKYLEKYDQADSLWQLGLAVTRKENQLAVLAKLYVNLAILPQHLGSPLETAYHDSSYAIATRLGDRTRLATVAGNRGIMYTKRGDFIKAEQSIQQAIAIAKLQKSERALATWYLHYGRLLMEMRRFDEANKYYDLSAGSADSVGYKEKLIHIKRLKGDLYRNVSLNRLAIAFYTEAIRLAANHQPLRLLRSKARIGIADIHLETGRFKQAREIYSAEIRAANKIEGLARDPYWYYRRARTYIEEGNLDKATKDLLAAEKVAKRIQDEQGRVWAIYYLAEIALRKGDIKTAEDRLLSALNEVSALADSSALAAVYFGLGRLRQTTGDFQSAIANYKKSSYLIENTRGHLRNSDFRIGYFAKGTDVYDGLIDCYYQLYMQNNEVSYMDALHHFIEMKRGRSLREMVKITSNENLGTAEAANYSKACNNLQRKLRFLRTNAANLQKEQLAKTLDEIEVARMSLLSQRLRLTRSGLSSQSETRGPNIPTLQKKLKESKMGLVQFHLTDDVSFALVFTGQQKKFVPLKITATEAENKITTLVAPFHKMTAGTLFKTPFHANLAHELYRELVLPLEAKVNLPDKLIIIPDVALLNLPFELLLREASASAVFLPTQDPVYARDFLQQDYAFVYLPTSTLLTRPERWFWQKPNLLVMANPFEDLALLTDSQPIEAANQTATKQLQDVHMRSGFKMEPLPDSEIEADDIKRAYARTKVLTKLAATAKAMLAGVDEYDLLHISTHGIVDSLYDSFSGLVLALAPKDTLDDGLLLGYEISERNFDYDLISLSACETGRGRPVKGEGILGLPRLFLSAGAKSVIMTHWKVEDAFSATLMPNFYEQFLNGNLSKSEALAKAKRDILNGENSRFKHPVFWAAFTLYGDPGQGNRIYLENYFLPSAVFSLLCLFSVWYNLKRRKAWKDQDDH